MLGRKKIPVRIEDVQFDALIEQTLEYSAEVPEYPTEKGYAVSDNISLKAETLSMTLILSDTPVTWSRLFSQNAARTERMIKSLQDLYYSRKIVTVTTSDATYKDMAITSISIRKTLENGYSREIPITLQKVIVTESKTTTIPDDYKKAGKTQANAGNANTAHGATGNGLGGLLGGQAGTTNGGISGLLGVSTSPGETVGVSFGKSLGFLH